ncbi:YdcF family protein [Aquicella lusitana]|uniref:YdcF family protein n=1 Tax=Aquicella lusitana TaxID=254246 RepID=UPI0014767D68|nr:YdcF family protein [Aquicella lusitana]
MATIIIFCVFLLAGGLALFRYSKTSLILFMASLSSFLLVGDGILPALLLNWLESPFASYTQPSDWKKTNAIVLLGAGTMKHKYNEIQAVKPSLLAYSRINRAAQLYFSCKKSGNACTVIVSGGDTSGSGVSEAVVYSESLVQLGIQPTDIQLEPASKNTFKNAEFTSKILKSKHYDQVFLVTSSLHLKRALSYFSHFGIEAIPVPSDFPTPSLSIMPSSYHFVLMDLAMHECAGIARLHVYNFLGWNASVVSPGAV